MNYTHEITSMGRKIRVQQTMPNIGVDDTGNEWPLRIAPGQRGYQIKKLRKQQKSAIRDTFADDTNELAERLGEIR